MINKIKDLDIKVIAPSHGFILRDNVKKFIDIYDNMSKNTNKDKKAVVVYSSMTSNTKKIALLIEENLKKDNIDSKAIDVNKTDKEEVLQAVKEADAVFIGSSTKYGDMIGKLEDVLKELKDMNLEGKIAAAFGSYGWSGEAIEVIQDYLNQSNMKVLNTSEIIKSTGMSDIYFPMRIRFSAKGDTLKEIERSSKFVSDLLN
ncbi:Anaerobic nitric oxide reductase flavorubredoxin [bioreactor metagenome]|uniref:Anaerobic nitric oxide reductase flavorubredoxin n=1 Tax=bioreactor metagenome TaxID=1076179 RepID=A0A645DDL4_9ZZZZ